MERLNIAPEQIKGLVSPYCLSAVGAKWDNRSAVWPFPKWFVRAFRVNFRLIQEQLGL